MTLFAIFGVCLNDECGFKISLRTTEMIFFCGPKNFTYDKSGQIQIKSTEKCSCSCLKALVIIVCIFIIFVLGQVPMYPNFPRSKSVGGVFELPPKVFFIPTSNVTAELAYCYAIFLCSPDVEIYICRQLIITNSQWSVE